MKNQMFKTVCLALAIVMGGLMAQAFPTSQFASTSKLASGHWVKVSIPTTGIYELTYAELREMGFSNPENVRVYGQGGNVMSEILDGSAIDDLQRVPVRRVHDKICFYGLGPVSFTLVRNNNADYFTRTLNTYSTAGYYFLVDEGGDEFAVLEGENNADANVDRDNSVDYYYHELDRVSPSLSGKVMLGESLLAAPYTVTLTTPRIQSTQPMAVQSSVAAMVNSGSSNITNTINGTRVSTYSTSTQFEVPWSADEIYYDLKAPVGFITPPEMDGGLTLSVSLTGGDLKLGLLDYTILSYKQSNELPGDAEANQLRMGLTGLNIDERILISNADDDAEVWEVSNGRDPMRYSLMDAGNGQRAFAPNTLSSAKMYVAFNPSKTLMKISGYENVNNQNLHGMEVPDLLIITEKSIVDQAERLADIHRQADGIDVAVVDQEEVFNEFSSGTPDAMAYRLLCKMLYDRDNVKFKNLLLLGTGSYDNRQLLNKRQCSLLAYESDESGLETSTYASDDFFGMLDDNSGQTISTTMLSIGVGRITCTSPEQCRTDIDKLERYLLSPNYEPWRNEVMVMGDDYDNGLHEFQAEGLCNIIDANTDSTMANNRVFLRQFYRPDYATKGQDAGKCKQSTEAVKSHLQDGQYFVTYVGHAGAGGLTKRSGMWNNVRILSTSYEHLPVMSMACCNTARWDNAGDFIGMAENMLHKSDGGVIAVMSSGRSCLATDNDALNQAFINALFCYEREGEFTTIGQAYKEAKRSFGSRIPNTNKLTFNLLGDPAIRFKYPKELFKVVSLNGEAVRQDTQVESGVMQRLDIVAHVLRPGTNEIDATFNGDGVATLFGEEAYDRTLTQNVYVSGQSRTVTRDVHYPREKIAQVAGRVVNGVFEGTIIVPTSVTLSGNPGAIKMFAHRDDSDEMVNGRFTNLVLDSYDPEKAVADDAAPVIDALYFDEAPDFESGDLVDADVTLRIKAHDDVALNTSRGEVSGSMMLVIDGKVSSPQAYDYATSSDNGRRVEVVVPMSGLSAGEHTLLYSVYDVAGKKATKSVTFFVGTKFDNALTVAQNPASTQAVFDYTSAVDGTVTVKVFDNVGNLVWKADNAQFPLQWNLKNSQGQRVPAGVYKVAATAVSGVSSSGTSYQELIVVEPYHTSN